MMMLIQKTKNKAILTKTEVKSKIELTKHKQKSKPKGLAFLAEYLDKSAIKEYYEEKVIY